MNHASDGARLTAGAARDGERGAGLIRSLLGLLVVAIIAVVIFVAVNGDDSDAKDDVEVQACEADPGGGRPTARGQVTNSSSKTSTYVITVQFKDPEGNDLSEGLATLRSVEPDEPAAFQLTGARSASGELTCEVTKVARTSLPG